MSRLPTDIAVNAGEQRSPTLTLSSKSLRPDKYAHLDQVLRFAVVSTAVWGKRKPTKAMLGALRQDHIRYQEACKYFAFAAAVLPVVGKLVRLFKYGKPLGADTPAACWFPC